jgi:hypothetical protein
MTPVLRGVAMTKVLALVLLGLLAFPQTLLAERTSPAGIRNDVSASTGPLYEAALQEAARLGATLRVPSPAQAQPPQRSWASRHPVLMGALVGAGAGAGITMLGCKVMGDDQGIVSCYVWVPILAGVGSGVGAVTGWVRSR